MKAKEKAIVKAAPLACGPKPPDAGARFCSAVTYLGVLATESVP
jgi:hypothetical protein